MSLVFATRIHGWFEPLQVFCTSMYDLQSQVRNAFSRGSNSSTGEASSIFPVSGKSNNAVPDWHRQIVLLPVALLPDNMIARPTSTMSIGK